MNIEFTDGTVFNACLRTDPFVEAKHTVDEGGAAARVAGLLLSDTSALKHI